MAAGWGAALHAPAGGRWDGLLPALLAAQPARQRAGARPGAGLQAPRLGRGGAALAGSRPARAWGRGLAAVGAPFLPLSHIPRPHDRLAVVKALVDFFGSRRGRWLGGLALLVVAGAALASLVLALAPTYRTDASATLGYADLASRRAVRDDIRGEPKPGSVLKGAPIVPPPVLYLAPIVRLRIPRIGVDAPVQVKNIKNGQMENPDGAANVAWYDFTAKPGLGAGNAVFSGHVDYVNVGKAVFWDLKKLVNGDIVEVVLQDGVIVSYTVSASQSYDVATIPMDQVLNSTSTESVTLITCGGQFSAGSYNERLVLRATRSGVATP